VAVPGYIRAVWTRIGRGPEGGRPCLERGLNQNTAGVSRSRGRRWAESTETAAELAFNVSHGRGQQPNAPATAATEPPSMPSFEYRGRGSNWRRVPAGLENRQWPSRSLVGSNPTPAASPFVWRMVGRFPPSFGRSASPARRRVVTLRIASLSHRRQSPNSRPPSPERAMIDRIGRSTKLVFGLWIAGRETAQITPETTPSFRTSFARHHYGGDAMNLDSEGTQSPATHADLFHDAARLARHPTLQSACGAMPVRSRAIGAVRLKGETCRARVGGWFPVIAARNS
jgi:hypothetical protein